jgi:hypothetical protein
LNRGPGENRSGAKDLVEQEILRFTQDDDGFTQDDDGFTRNDESTQNDEATLNNDK